uniref:Essential protein Yae1 N-terminal domain-containing protein n=1 Tax=Salix viminalis TaxID=40686 RepID=A0A6N2JW27_SALVM
MQQQPLVNRRPDWINRIPYKQRRMESSFAKELFSESLQLSNAELGFQEKDRESDLDRDWQRGRDQFHTIGYRDGLMAGREASAQGGFNVGFKQSVLVGHNWGVVRGVTSVLTFLPDDLKEKLIETQEKRKKIRVLDALIFFRDDIMRKKLMEQTEPVKKSSDVARMNRMIAHAADLEIYVGELQSLLDSPTIKLHLSVK